MNRLAIVLASLVAVLVPGTAHATTTLRPAVIVVGVAGLRWDAVDPTSMPAIWALAAHSALGVASVKAADPVSCPEDGWLTLGAGDRANSFASCSASPAVTASPYGGATVSFGDLVTRNRRATDATQIGDLADKVDRAGGCVAAAGPDAALGAASPAGVVNAYSADATAASGDAGFLAQCSVTLIAADAASVDTIVGRVETAAPRAVLLVVGVSEIDATKAHLHVAIAHGAGFTGGRLTSASTRRASFVQLVDVAPTILAEQGIGIPTSMIGQPWRTSGSSPARSVRSTVSDLNQLDLRAQAQERAIVPFFVTEVCLMIAFGLLAWAIARGQSSRWARLATPVRAACVTLALVPSASFLVGVFPWWRSGDPTLVVMLGAAASALVAALAVLGIDAIAPPSRFRLATSVGLITTGVIGIDLLTGGSLEMFTMNGYSPLVAGRFAGIGNVGFAVFGAAALLSAVAAFEMFGLIGFVVVAAGVVVIDGGPPWGSDVGGVLSLVPALALLALMLRGSRISWSKAAATVVGAVAVGVLLGAVDYSRPADHQTHLGRFVGRVLHGGAWTILRRKAISDADLLTHSAITLLIPALVVASVVLVRRPRGVLLRGFDEIPVLRPTLVALLVLSLVAALVNDSGVVVPAVLSLLVLPLVMAMLVTPAALPATASVDAIVASQ